jgi:hypothetical protein
MAVRRSLQQTFEFDFLVATVEADGGTVRAFRVGI